MTVKERADAGSEVRAPWFGEEVRSAEHFFAWFAHLGRTGIYRVHEVARTRAALRALHVL